MTEQDCTVAAHFPKESSTNLVQGAIKHTIINNKQISVITIYIFLKCRRNTVSSILVIISEIHNIVSPLSPQYCLERHQARSRCHQILLGSTLTDFCDHGLTVRIPRAFH